MIIVYSQFCEAPRADLDRCCINIAHYYHFKDVSINQLRDISPLNSLTHMLTLKADRNLLNSAKLDEVSIIN